MRRLALSLVACLMTAAPALASANVSCLIDDSYVRFELEAIAGRAGSITQVQVGEIEIKAGKRKFIFDLTHIVQQWSLGGDMRLQIEIGDDEAKQNVNLVILARLDAKTEKYYGRYLLKILRDGKAMERKGRIKNCEAG